MAAASRSLTESQGAPYLVATPNEVVIRFTTLVDSSFRFEPLEFVDSPNPGPLMMTSFDERSAMGAEVHSGSLVYNPPAGFVGEDSYTFVISDGVAQTRFTVLMSVMAEELPLEAAAPAQALPVEPVYADTLPFTGVPIHTGMLVVSALMVLASGASLLVGERRRTRAGR